MTEGYVAECQGICAAGGHPASDVEAVHDALLRVSRLVEEVPDLGALDLNVRAFGPGQGAGVPEARISVAPGQETGG